MNKIFAEILAGWIPHKPTRNRWRGILRYGIINAIRLKKMLKHERATPPKYNLAVCAIAKNEGSYFEEWIEWHKKMGVEKFFIYDNESSDNTKEVLKPYIESELVEYSYLPGKKQQLPAYDECLKKHRLDVRWIAVIDIDEFIVPIKDKTIPEFLKRFEDFSAVEINWLVYGSGGAKKKECGGVVERFRHHSPLNHRLNKHVKTIIDPRRVFNFIGCHEAAVISDNIADSHGNVIKKQFRDRETLLDVIRINHYATKSHEECFEKLNRGKANSSTQYQSNYFEMFDLNDIEETEKKCLKS